MNDELDIIQFLDDYDIPYKEQGKNIGRDWIGIGECPFCGDDRYHFGINKVTKVASCFVCTESAGLGRFIKEKLGYDWKEIKGILKNYSNGTVYVPRESGNNVVLPSGIKDISDRGLKYLHKRNFYEDIIDQFQLKQTGIVSNLKLDGYKSDFSNRIFIPIIMNKRLVSYTARSMTNADPKYNNPIIEACIVPTGSCIYNYDTLKENDTGVFMEGPTDVWRFGDKFVSMMGVKYSKKQISFIAAKKLSKAIILFDKGAEEKARKLAHNLTGIIPVIKLVFLKKGDDPGGLSPYDAIRLKYDLLRL